MNDVERNTVVEVRFIDGIKMHGLIDSQDDDKIMLKYAFDDLSNSCFEFIDIERKYVSKISKMDEQMVSKYIDSFYTGQSRVVH